MGTTGHWIIPQIQDHLTSLFKEPLRYHQISHIFLYNLERKRKNASCRTQSHFQQTREESIREWVVPQLFRRHRKRGRNFVFYFWLIHDSFDILPFYSYFQVWIFSSLFFFSIKTRYPELEDGLTVKSPVLLQRIQLQIPSHRWWHTITRATRDLNALFWNLKTPPEICLQKNNQVHKI